MFNSIRKFGGSLSAIAVAGFILAACSPTQVAQFQTAEASALAKGQLFCKQAGVVGPAVTALVTLAGVPLVVTGAASADVAAACAVVGMIPAPGPATGPVTVVPAAVAPLVPAPVTTGMLSGPKDIHLAKVSVVVDGDESEDDGNALPAEDVVQAVLRQLVASGRCGLAQATRKGSSTPEVVVVCPVHVGSST